MRKLGLAIAAAAMVGLFAGSVWAHHDKGSHVADFRTGNDGPAGAHYNLNIIGVDVDKTTDMKNSNRHTIFVALGLKKPGASIKSNIYLTQGDFQVCDGNGFDTAFDCTGTALGGGKTGAVFQLPCNTNLPGGDLCTTGDKEAYEVWVRELGKPGGEAKITTCAEDSFGTDFCSTENVLLVRASAQPKFREVTNELTSLVLADGTRVRLFQSGFVDWVWEYDNNGLRLAQLRFYVI